MIEIWKFYKEIKQSNQYFKGGDILTVSNLGRVKCNGEFYNCTIGKDGYYYLGKKLLHRIIAEKFLPNPYNLPCVDHINTVKTDNRASNLCWVTHKTNNNNPLSIQHYIESHPGKPVLQYTKDNKFVTEFISVSEASRQTKIYDSNIISCCKNKLKSTGGYIWKYKEE